MSVSRIAGGTERVPFACKQERTRRRLLTVAARAFAASTLFATEILSSDARRSVRYH